MPAKPSTAPPPVAAMAPGPAGLSPLVMWAVGLALALPWLNPVAPGPSPAVVPLLFAWNCAAVLLALVAPRAIARWHLAWWLGLAFFVAAHGDPANPEVYVSLAGLGVMLACALVGARMVRDRSSHHYDAGDGDNWLLVLAWAWLAAGLLSSTAALAQFFDLDAWLSPWVNQTAPGEAYANLRQRNQFATHSMIALAALLWLVEKRRIDVGGVFMMLLLVAGNAASASRTGLLAVLLVAALAWLWRHGMRGHARWLAWLAPLAYAGALAGLALAAGGDWSGGAIGRFADEVQPCATRWPLYRAVAELIAERPGWGWGWRELAWAHHMLDVQPASERFCDIPDNAHNLPLHLAAELGLPATLLLLGGLALAVLRARPWREVQGRRRLAWTVLALLALHSLLEYPLWYGPFQIALGLCAGMLWPGKGKEAAPCGARRALGVLAHYGSVLALLALLTHAAWDYRRISQIYLPPDARLPAYREDTLNKISDSWLFANQVRFARLSVTPPTRDNAAEVLALAQQVLHYSPEPRVIEPLIEAATLLGQDELAAFHFKRYREAFPQDHARWVAGHAKAEAGKAEAASDGASAPASGESAASR